VLSTDHPNGGTFLSYPELIRLLMDRAYRDERLKRVNQKLLRAAPCSTGCHASIRSARSPSSRGPGRPGSWG